MVVPRLGMGVLTSLFLAFSLSSWGQQTVVLTQRSVAEKVLVGSSKSQEVNYKYEQTRLLLAQTMAGYDFNFSIETGYEYSKFMNFARTQNDQDETLKTVVSLKKPLTTGTLLGLEYNRNAIKSVYSATSTSTVPTSQTQDIFGVTIEQSLLRNSFGRADRAKVKAAQKTYQAGLENRVDELESLVLDGIRLYWKAYVSQETFQEALNSRERYQKLVEAVRKKTSYGYSNPGELAQVQAELEGRIQKVKSESTHYLGILDQLLTFLNLPAGSEVKFQVQEEIPPLPILPRVETEKLRSIRALKESAEAADASLMASSSSAYPELALVGKYYQSGLDQDSSTSFGQMTGSSRPKYYVGLKFTYNFGSDVQSEDEYNKRITRDLAQSQLSRRSLEVKDSLADAERKVQSTFSIAESSKIQRAYREKAAQELNRAYTQGRTDINTLITSLNNYFDSEIQYSKAIGDYQTALNEWAAARDELIPDLKN
jgi:outer membrane protein TolC